MSDNPVIREAKQLTAEAGRMLLAEGLAARTWGNVSCRTGETGFVITPSGLGYPDMTADDIVSMDWLTGYCEKGKTPSSEMAVHIAAYRVFPSAGFVIHTHQTCATALGLAELERMDLTDDEKEELGGIALAAYGSPGSSKLAENVESSLKTGAHTVLMAHHGALIVGESREEAFSRAKRLEELCRRACYGFPNSPGPVAPARRPLSLEALKKAAKQQHPYVFLLDSPALRMAAKISRRIPAQLDDMAQMVGPWLAVIPPRENLILQALKHHDVVLVPGLGAVSRAETYGDSKALCLLAEKACICFLHTKVLGADARLSLSEIHRLRRNYLLDYSKRMQRKPNHY